MDTTVDKLIGWMLAFCVFVLSVMLVLVVVAVFFGADHTGDMMRQCVADGKPEYECYSMIYKGRTVK